MDYYRRYNEDGSCETVCMRCFLTLGQAKKPAQLKPIEAAHVCRTPVTRFEHEPLLEDGPIWGSVEPALPATPLWHFLGRMKAAHAILMSLSILVCLYVLPTVIELELKRHLGTWLSCILLGDMAGCAFLSLGLGLRKTGISLYVFLTACEAWLYAARIMPAHLLVWLVDAAPTLMVLSLITFFFWNSRFGTVVIEENL